MYKLYSSLPELEQRKTWAEIDLDALRRNYRLLREMATAENPSVRMIAVVKAEAYRHGAPPALPRCWTKGATFSPSPASMKRSLSARSATRTTARRIF